MAQTTIDSNEKLWSKKKDDMSPKILILLPFPPLESPGKVSLIMSENLLKLKFEQSKYRHWSGGIHRGRLANVLEI